MSKKNFRGRGEEEETRNGRLNEVREIVHLPSAPHSEVQAVSKEPEKQRADVNLPLAPYS